MGQRVWPGFLLYTKGFAVGILLLPNIIIGAVRILHLNWILLFQGNTTLSADKMTIPNKPINPFITRFIGKPGSIHFYRMIVLLLASFTIINIP